MVHENDKSLQMKWSVKNIFARHEGDYHKIRTARLIGRQVVLLGSFPITIKYRLAGSYIRQTILAY